MFQLNTISAILFITTVINIVAAVIAWQRRKKTRSGLYFALGMMGITLWTLAAGFDYAAVPISLKVFFATLEAWGYMTALPIFALATLSFAGYDRWIENKWVKALFLLIPVSNILLVSTNGLHGWVWKGFTQVTGNIVIFEHGPAFTWISLNGYLMILLIIVTLWMAMRKGSDIVRRQGRLLLGAALFPLAANVVYQYVGGAEGVDWTSVTFSVTGLLFLRALYGTRFLDLVPIAREKLMSSLSDGMLVLDTQGRIIDVNQPAAQMIGFLPEKLVGRNLDEMMPFTRSLVEWNSGQEIRTELEVGGTSKRFFDVLISPLWEKGEKVIGRLIVFRDITDRRQASMDLERRYLEIQELNKDLRETQAQLVEQQRALAIMEERQRLSRDLHDSVTQSINGMVLFTDTLAATLEKNNIVRARQIMERLQESAKQSLKETRLLLYELQESGPERSVDLIRDLEDRLAMVERRIGLRGQLIQEGSLENCPPEWHENLFWIAVEALNNSIKHGQAHNVQVVVRCSPERLELEVTDDGKGFDPHTVEAGGLGLKNLRERADIIGGMLSIESEPSKGTTVRFRAEIGMEQK